ncbi:MAG: four-carbon acid sugar kinase family protein, partial [Clostridia bacterium]|nr:four-carbon acid sugar kinase family protein [Clostridia bacterium]
VKIAQQGVPTAVVGIEALTPFFIRQAPDVLVVSTETRHQAPQDAYETVYKLVRMACEIWPETALYKKTDSALRGNVGGELAAMLDAAGVPSIAYIPALPNQGRVTVKGCQLDHGRPIHETVFAIDCYAPVFDAYIPRIIAAQTDIRTLCVPVGRAGQRTETEAGEKEIWVYDAETAQDMQTVARALKAQGRQRVTAGCAGFAECLVSMLDLEGMPADVKAARAKRLCMICGSVNPITQRQIDAVRREGMTVIPLPAAAILSQDFDVERLIRTLLEKLPSHDSFAVTTADINEPEEKMAYARRLGLGREDVRCTISQRLGLLAERLCERDRDLVPMLIGGDTLYGFLKAIGGKVVHPVSELQPGCVMSRYVRDHEERWILTKSGGIGDEKILTKLRDALEEKDDG